MICNNCGKEYFEDYRSPQAIRKIPKSSFCSEVCRLHFRNASGPKEKQHCKECGRELSLSKIGFCRSCGNKNPERRAKNSEGVKKAHKDRPEAWINKEGLSVGGGWNRGLTADSDSRVASQRDKTKARYASGDLVAYQKGKPHTNETKAKISKSRIKFLEGHPDQAPYLLNHYSKGPSYPERYWIDLIKNEGLNFDFHKRIWLYELDFFNENKKIDLEIDGDQHYSDPRIIESDKRRTEYLEGLGWKVIRIRWSDWQKKSLEEKKEFVADLRALTN
jgi:very-short-patch-repair endonuclease